ncbi:MAG: efflux RND transporter periplasmic adaptor subunit [Candidatus Aminicenantia bacterium]
MNKLIKIIFINFLVIVLFLFPSCRRQEEAEDIQTSMTPVGVIEVNLTEISKKLTYTGTLEAWKKIDIIPDIAGKIAHIYVQEGESVKKGQLLAELDTRSIRLQLEQAEAALAVTKANYLDAKRNKERMDKLYQQKAVSEQQYEKIKLAYDAARAQLLQAQAAVNLAKYNLDISIMKAPFSGVIASKNAEVGDVINPLMGSFSPTSGVLTLMDFSKIKINLNVPQSEINQIKIGQEAILRINTLPGKKFEGRVNIVNLAADPVSKTFQVQVTFDNPHLLLKPGTFGEVSILTEIRSQTIVLPDKAIIDDKYVFVVENGKAVKKEVTIGIRTGQQVEISGGIEPGDLVIVEGNYGLEDKTTIRIKD